MGALAGSKRFPKIDLADAYLHIPLSKHSKPLTSFKTLRVLHHYNSHHMVSDCLFIDTTGPRGNRTGDQGREKAGEEDDDDSWEPDADLEVSQDSELSDSDAEVVESYSGKETAQRKEREAFKRAEEEEDPERYHSLATALLQQRQPTWQGTDRRWPEPPKKRDLPMDLVPGNLANTWRLALQANVGGIFSESSESEEPGRLTSASAVNTHAVLVQLHF